jgi:hypothetical protein
MLTNPIDTAAERATAAIKALADAGHRQANEHAHALDLLRAQVESLRAINAGLRERASAGISAHDDVDAAGWVERVSMAIGIYYDYDGGWTAAESKVVVEHIKEQNREIDRLRERIEVLEHRVSHTAEVLAMPVDTEGPREVVLARGHGWMHEVGAEPSDDSYDKRSAVIHKTGWVAYAPHGWKPRRGGLTEEQARTWVLDGVLP